MQNHITKLPGRKVIIVLFILLMGPLDQYAQQKTINDVMDSTTMSNLIKFSQKYSSLSFSGYMQPQYQFAETRGVQSEYQGGSFAENSDNRFRLRRGRLRADYTHYHKDGSPSTYFVFQFDGTEQGVNIRDFWGRYFENRFKLFSVTVGLQGRPFGNELIVSSSEREAPERGRMSQILMKTERDLGVTLTINPRSDSSRFKNIRLDIGMYNGQGLAGPMEFDRRKDFIVRLSHKYATLKNTPFRIAGGLSALVGGLNSQLPVMYSMIRSGGEWTMAGDSSASNIDKAAPRQYYGADLQISTQSKSWRSELRAEYITGLQTGTESSSQTPGTYPLDKAGAKIPFFTRPFEGAYFTFVQYLGSPKYQAIAKYDFYDPNKKVKGLEVSPDNGFTAADVKYNTFGFGLLHHFNQHFKIVVYYDYIINEKTLVKDFTRDRKDNILTIRTQFTF